MAPGWSPYQSLVPTGMTPSASRASWSNGNGIDTARVHTTGYWPTGSAGDQLDERLAKTRAFDRLAATHDDPLGNAVREVW